MDGPLVSSATSQAPVRTRSREVMTKSKDEDGKDPAPGTGGQDKPPPFGQEVPINSAGKLPRVIVGDGKQPAGNYRAPDGTTRYKIRAKAFPDLGTLYVLAKQGDEAGA